MKSSNAQGGRQFAIPVLLACTVIANVAAFSNRAVYIDENLFLSVARMKHDWGIFPSGEWFFFGNLAPLAAHTHSPFGEWCLSLLFAIFERFDERVFRLVFGSLFSIVAVSSFYCLARRVSNHPGLLALLFLSSPAFFVFSPTLMMDVPMLALLLAGLHAYLKGVEGSDVGLLVSASCFTVSVAFGYAALIPLVCLFATVLWKRRPVREFAAIATPFVAMVIWEIALTIHYGELPLIKTFQHFSRVGSIGQNVLATPSFLGGVTVFPWLMLLLSFRENRRATLRVAVASVASALLLSCFVGWITLRYGLWYIFLASAGVALILLFARQLPELLQNRGILKTFLAFTFPAVLLFFIVVGEFISARYLLLAMPWLYLALFQRAEQRQLGMLIAATLALSIAVAIADYRFVDAYRDWVTANVASVEREGHLWNSGESGLRFYLEERGARTLSNADSRPQGGDLIVRQRMFRYALSEHIETMLVTLKTWELTDRFPLRTFNQEAGAGFHGSGLGMVPFAVSRRPYDFVEIAQITPLAQTQPAAVWSKEGPLLIQQDAVVTVPVKLPPHTRVDYELMGQGTVEIHEGLVTLRKEQTGPIAWRNFRMVPEALLSGQ
jgi:hypothetical protein